MLAKDIKCINGEIIFGDNGDISLHDANIELVQCLYVTNKGEFRKSPIKGLNIMSYINAPFSPINQQRLENNIKTELKNDGFDIKDLRISYDYKLKDYVIKTNVDRTR